MSNSEKAEICLAIFFISTLMVLSIYFWDYSQYISSLLLLVCIYQIIDGKLDDTLTEVALIVYPIVAWNTLFLMHHYINSFFIVFIIGILLYLIYYFKNEDSVGLVWISSIGYGLIYILIFNFGIWGVVISPIVFSIIGYLIMNIDNEMVEDGCILMLFFYLFLILFIIYLFSSPYDSSSNNYLNKEQVELESQIKNEIEIQELEVKKSIELYFDSLKRVDSYYEKLHPEFKQTQTFEDGKRKISSEFSYRSIDIDVKHYRPGKYHLIDSPAAEEMLRLVDNTIRNFLLERLEQSNRIQIDLHGFSDALRFNPDRPVLYDGSEGSFPKKKTQDQDKIYDYVLNGKRISISLKEGDKLNNNILAFLRAYCMKEEYLNDIIFLQRYLDKTNYTYNATTLEGTNIVGGEHRKVKIVIHAINPQNLPPVPIPNNRCSNLLKLILFILEAIIIRIAFFHYKRYHIKKDKKENAEVELLKIIIFVIVGIVIFLVMLWFCPSLLEL